MKLRLAKLIDCQPTRDLFRGLLSEGDEKVFYSSFNSMNGNCDPRLLIAALEDDSGNLIGAISIRNSKEDCEIIALKVIPEYQGRGYGKFMAGMAAEFYNNHGYSKYVRLRSTQEAVNFWSHIGFKFKDSVDVMCFGAVHGECENLESLAKYYRENNLRAIVDEDLQSTINKNDRFIDNITISVYEKYKQQDLLQNLLTKTKKVLKDYEDDCAKLFSVSADPQRTLLISEITQCITQIEPNLSKANIQKLNEDTHSLIAKLKSYAERAEKHHRESGLTIFGMKLTTSRLASKLNEFLTKEQDIVNQSILNQTEEKLNPRIGIHSLGL